MNFNICTSPVRGGVAVELFAERAMIVTVLLDRAKRAFDFCETSLRAAAADIWRILIGKPTGIRRTVLTDAHPKEPQRS